MFISTKFNKSQKVRLFSTHGRVAYWWISMTSLVNKIIYRSRVYYYTMTLLLLWLKEPNFRKLFIFKKFLLFTFFSFSLFFYFSSCGYMSFQRPYKVSYASTNVHFDVFPNNTFQAHCNSRHIVLSFSPPRSLSCNTLLMSTTSLNIGVPSVGDQDLAARVWLLQ